MEKALEYLNLCPLCQSQEIKFLGLVKYNSNQDFSGEKLGMNFNPGLFGCKKCLSKFVSPRLSKSYARQLYSESLATRWIPENSEELEDIDSLFLNYTPSGFKNFFLKNIVKVKNKDKQVLDVGCFRGRLLDIFKYYNFKTFGFDLNEDAIKQIGNRHKVFFGDIENISQFKTKFDIITAFDIIEHLYDIEKFWRNIFGNLKKDGLCLILTGNPNALGARVMKNKWWYFRYPEHIIFPSAEYYRSLEKEYNCSVEKIFYVHHRQKYRLPITDHFLISIKKYKSIQQ